MKKLSIVLFILVFMLSFSLIGSGQEIVIEGTTVTFDSIPLVNASIKVKSTKQIVATDTMGSFSVACNSTDVLIVSAKGFYTQRVKLDDKTKLLSINLKLKPGIKNRDYAIGYGHVTDAERLNSVSNMNSNDLDFSQYTNMYDLIRGRFSGVQIVNNEIIIRGVNSINSSNAALIVIDGIMSSGDLGSISPVDVKSISIIKDGSAAIYGSRGANGVVIIETKRGGD